MPTLELALESKFRESGDSPMSFELSWRPGGSVGVLINLFGFFELTMVVVRGREVGVCLEASSSSSTLVVVTDASAIPPRNMQAISAAHFWRLGHQVSSSKAPAGRTTAPDAELFAIRLGVSKATSMDIECIILITDSLGSARRSVDPSVHKPTP